MTVRRDQEISVTAGVSLTGDETNKIAAAFPPGIRHKSAKKLRLPNNHLARRVPMPSFVVRMDRKLAREGEYEPA